MNSLLKIAVEPVGSLGQRAAAGYVGGLTVLRDLEENWGLVPWDENPTNRRYRVSSIEAAMERAEQAVFLKRREKAPQSVAAE